MAHDFAAAARTAFQTFHQTVRAYTASWQTLTAPIVEEDPTYQEAEIFGLTTYAAQVASPTPLDMESGNSSTSAAPFERVVKLTLKEVKDNPKILESTAAALAGLGGLTLTNAFWTTVKAADSTAHPHTGESWIGTTAGTGGEAVKICDNFKFFPINSVAAFTQDNLFTSAGFSAGQLTTVLAAKDEYLDKSGNPVYEEGDKPFVIVPASQKQKALDLMKQGGEIYDGSGLQSGSMQERAEGVIVPPGVTTSTDWWTWQRKRRVSAEGKTFFTGPIIPWLRVAPSVTFTIAPASHHVYVKAYMEYAIHIAPDCDLNLQMCQA